jgi:hypothetical protein
VFRFTINLGGNFEPRVRPDWFADFLYGDEFPASLIQRARQLQPQVGAIKYFVLGLDSGAGTTPQISPVAGTADQVPIASHQTLLRLAEGILKFARTDKCLVKPDSWLVKPLVADLELDGYELRNGNVVVPGARIAAVYRGERSGVGRWRAPTKRSLSGRCRHRPGRREKGQWIWKQPLSAASGITVTSRPGQLWVRVWVMRVPEPPLRGGQTRSRAGVEHDPGAAPRCRRILAPAKVEADLAPVPRHQSGAP